MSQQHSRRKFLRQLGGTAALLGSGALPALASDQSRIITLTDSRTWSANDQINIACIGMGIMGFGDVQTALKIPGVKLVAVADLYEGRLTRAKEVFGNDIFTTRDYREVLERKDVDAVIIATSDHWHDRISIDAMNKGKHVYCEKPMVHRVEEGKAVIDTQKKTGVVFQVGSQAMSGLDAREAKKHYMAGMIGRLNLIEATNDRHGALGAWQYSIPPDASPKTVDWDRYLGDAPKRPYDPKHFFWWRNYREYGTGVAGDLFVHLITMVHYITDSLGPTRIYATGDLSYWKDGRNVPDVMTAILEYPETEKHPKFQLQLRVNFAAGTGGGSTTKFIGSEGVIDMGWGGFTMKQRKLPKAPGYGSWDSYSTFPEAIQKQFKEQYDQKYSEADRRVQNPPDTVYRNPQNYDAREEHFRIFFESIRTKKPLVIQDATFGLRACGPALACNESYFRKKEIVWDPVAMKMV